MNSRYKVGVSAVVLGQLFFGCVSGSIKSVAITNELPGDLPKEIQERFAIKDAPAGVFTAGGSELPAPSEDSSKGSKRKKKKREKKIVQAPPPFAYPSRRPAKDPIWISERLTFGISYFGVSAGELTLSVMPHKVIGNRKVYHIRANAVSSPVFSLFYRLNDVIESFIDYEGIFSHRFHLVLDETKQKRDALELYDSEKKQTYYWNRWERKDAPYTETKEFASIEPFSQDSISALYYIRTIPLSVGAVVSVPVVSEGKSWEAVCTVLRKEAIDTPMGKVQAFVIKPETRFQGVLRKTGDSFLWISDDDRRIPIRLEAKVKVGTVVAALIKIEPGTPPELASPLSQIPAPAPSLEIAPERRPGGQLEH